MNTIYPDLTKMSYDLYLLEFFTKASINFPTETHNEYLKECQKGEWTPSNKYFDNINSILSIFIFNYDNHKENPIFFEALESNGYRDAEKVIELLYKNKQMIERVWEFMYETR